MRDFTGIHPNSPLQIWEKKEHGHIQGLPKYFEYQLVVLGDLNAVSGTSRQGFENVVGPYGSGMANDNSFLSLIHI